MKPKKFSMKLNLKKSTVANLDHDEKKKIKGGCVPTGVNSCQSVTCLSDWDPCCLPPTVSCVTCFPRTCNC